MGLGPEQPNKKTNFMTMKQQFQGQEKARNGSSQKENGLATAGSGGLVLDDAVVVRMVRMVRMVRQVVVRQVGAAGAGLVGGAAERRLRLRWFQFLRRQRRVFQKVRGRLLVQVRVVPQQPVRLLQR